jgi:exosortase family protein XrtM
LAAPSPLIRALSAQIPGTPVRFAIKFVLIFALLTGGFEASRGSAFERFLVEELILRPTTCLINTVTPREQVELKHRTLSSPGSNLRVTRGCEGVEMFLMLMSAVLAFPANWRRRIQGLLAGSLLAYALSVTRLMALHYVLRYSASAWEALHGLILPLGPIIFMAVYFMRWTANARPAQAQET